MGRINVFLVGTGERPGTSLVETGKDKTEETRADADFCSPWKMPCLCLLGAKPHHPNETGWGKRGVQVREGH